MKKLKFFETLLFFTNSVVAFTLLLSYIVPFLPPKTFSSLSVLGLGVPLLIVLNVLFFVYWLVKIKKQLLLSLLVVCIGYFSSGSLYIFTESNLIADENNFSVMNYNVRLFNLYNWIPKKDTKQKLIEFINKESPDILSLQEYYKQDGVAFSSYKYKYEKLFGKKNKYGQVIFSKFPIINSGSIAFPKTANNAIFADVVKGKDTIRVYNIHLQSLRIDANVEKLSREDGEKLFEGVGQTFKTQQFQTELFLLHKKKCKYKMIICGDFNNTAFSYVYNVIKGELNDTFKAAGKGFGRTYNFKFFPMRIDFILVDKAFKINGFNTYNVKYSDHYPIKTTLVLP